LTLLAQLPLNTDHGFGAVLGAARSAVNKTIVHPEKLTLSKAEHVAAKK